MVSDRLNWFIVPGDDSILTLDPSTTAEYDLVNEYAVSYLIYEEREYGINLGWGAIDEPTLSLNVVRQDASDTTPIKYGEAVALGIRDGGYLRHGQREYGINLKWSEDPVYEWQIQGSGSSAGTDVRLGVALGLFNNSVGDTLFYDPRRYGINLKWLADKGKHNDTPWYESVVDAVGSFFYEFGTLVIEILNRVAGVIDFVLTLLGIMLWKELRVGIVVLRDTQGYALLADERLAPADLADDQQKLQKAVDVIRECLENLNVDLQTANGESSKDAADFYRILPFPAPSYALDVGCGAGLWGEDFGSAGQYFRRYASANRPFYGSPVTIFVVDEVADNLGCSLGPLTNWVVVEAAGFDNYTGSPNGVTRRPTTPMHEVGHACGLYHKGPRRWSKTPRNNLMIKSVPRGVQMTRLQRAIFRNSRHVTLV